MSALPKELQDRKVSQVPQEGRPPRQIRHQDANLSEEQQ